MKQNSRLFARHSLRTTMVAMMATILGLALPCAAAPSETPATDGGDGFCALAGPELLAALDGTWSLKQGAGVALGASAMGMAGTPLPAHGAQPLKLKYDADRGVSVLRSPDAPDQMIMFPVASGQTANAASAIAPGATGQSPDPGTSCDVNSLPIIVGTNGYALDREATTQLAGGAAATYFCGLIGMAGMIPPDPILQVCTTESTSEAAHGQMTMTLLVRFHSAHSGTGTLYFNGRMQGSVFAARAPIRLTR